MVAPITSSLSQACVEIRNFLQDKLKLDDSDIKPKVYFGSPKNSFEYYKEVDDWINMFFYRIEPSGFNSDMLPGDTGWLRLHCLITPVAKNVGVQDPESGDYVSEGEQDLRMLGEVIRVFHEYPQQLLGKGETQFHFQAVFQSLSIESINQIWSTQGSDVAYRPSAGYEFSLAPVVPREVKKKEHPLVASILSDANPNSSEIRNVDASSLEAQLNLTQTDAVQQSTYAVGLQLLGKIEVNTLLKYWAPYICFVGIEDSLSTTVNLLRSDIPESISVLVAGVKGATVRLSWNIWKNDGGDFSATWDADSTLIEKIIGESASDAQSTHIIDPLQMPDYLRHDDIDVPFDSSNLEVKQAVLSAVRIKDGKEVSGTQSNYLIINIYEVPDAS